MLGGEFDDKHKPRLVVLGIVVVGDMLDLLAVVEWVIIGSTVLVGVRVGVVIDLLVMVEWVVAGSSVKAGVASEALDLIAVVE